MPEIENHGADHRVDAGGIRWRDEELMGERMNEWMEVSMLANEWIVKRYEKNWIVFVKSEFVQRHRAFGLDEMEKCVSYGAVAISSQLGCHH